MASLSRQIRRTQMKRARRANEKGAKSLDRSLLRLQNIGVGIGGALVLLSAPAIAQAGDGFTVSVDGDTTTYNQTANKVYNRVDSYNIGLEEHHIYSQPSVDAVFLQRVTGQDPSSILGLLTANGQVWIMNPSGVLFGSEARINTAGFMASSLVMAEDDFFAGRYELSQEGDGGYVINKGTIDVNNGGYAILAGASVINDGYITADDGEVVLAAGRKMAFDFDGDGMINYAVDEAVAASIVGPDGADLTSAVLNSGSISGARVLMTASAARSVFDAVVNNEGVVEAISVSTEGGVIRLLGGDEGDVINTGTLDASGDAGGGEIQISGERVGNAGTIAANDTSGVDGGKIVISSTGKTVMTSSGVVEAKGGGEIRINQPDENGNTAEATLISEGAVITTIGGSDDGFIELSGEVLHVGGVDIQAGTILFDPYNIELKSVPGPLPGDSNVSFGDLKQAFNENGTTPGNTTIFDIDGGAGNVLLTAGNGATIIFEAVNDVTVGGANDIFDLNIATGSTAVNLEIYGGNNVTFGFNATIVADGAGTVKLVADAGFAGFPSDGSGSVLGAIGANAITTDTGNITLISGSDLYAPGITTTSGDISITVNNGELQTSGNTPITSTGGSNVDMIASGKVEINNPIVTEGGYLNIRSGGTIQFDSTFNTEVLAGGTPGGNVTLTAVDNITFTAQGLATSFITGGGNFTATADSDGNDAGSFSLGTNVTLDTKTEGDGRIVIIASNEVNVSGAIDAGTDNVYITSRLIADNIEIGPATGLGADFFITGPSIGNITTDDTLQFGGVINGFDETGAALVLTHSGPITVYSADGSGATGVDVIRLETTGDILDDTFDNTGIRADETIELIAGGKIGAVNEQVGIDTVISVVADTSG